MKLKTETITTTMKEGLAEIAAAIADELDSKDFPGMY